MQSPARRRLVAFALDYGHDFAQVSDLTATGLDIDDGASFDEYPELRLFPHPLDY
jgi:hypothetical protein